jgi:hypothetical protein
MHCPARWVATGIWLLIAASAEVGLDCLSAAAQSPPAPQPVSNPGWQPIVPVQALAPVPPIDCAKPTLNFSSSSSPPILPSPDPTDGDIPLPINLPTALRLADARPLVIDAAQVSLRQALAQYDQAKVLWLPNLYVGGSWYRHDGAAQGNSGNLEGVGETTRFGDMLMLVIRPQEVVAALQKWWPRSNSWRTPTTITSSPRTTLIGLSSGCFGHWAMRRKR